MCFCASISAQTTAFTYQGSLKDGASPANGNYDFEFKLFDSVSGTTQQGSTLQRLNVAVANGIFTVSLDFGAGTLPGADRFLDIGVRTAGSGGFTALIPRQSVNSAPYSVRSLNSTIADVATNADQLGGVAANQYVVTTDPRMTDARTPTAGSINYIQNQNAGAQLSSNFNISGNGTAGGTLSGNIVNAATQYNLGGSRILRSPGTGNLFAGFSAGFATTGFSNSFFGTSAGQLTTTGEQNSFFGNAAGLVNVTGNFNSFFGRSAGLNSTASDNSFFGYNAGALTTTGADNSFFGRSAGAANTTGFENSFFGREAGVGNTEGYWNSFFGRDAGRATTTGTNNSFFGTFTGISNTTGGANTLIGYSANVAAGNLLFATAIGANATVTTSSRVQLGRNGLDTVSIGALAAASGTDLCINGTVLSSCSSSRRYKHNFHPLLSGLNLIRQLQPVTFDWNERNEEDLGLIAEEVAAIEPLLVTYNDKGAIEGVKYKQLSVVLVNAIKEQQEQIEIQQRDNLELKKQVEALKAVVCSIKADADVCKINQDQK
jgi:hypothetical protein